MLFMLMLLHSFDVMANLQVAVLTPTSIHTSVTVVNTHSTVITQYVYSYSYSNR